MAQVRTSELVDDLEYRCFGADLKSSVCLKALATVSVLFNGSGYALNFQGHIYYCGLSVDLMDDLDYRCFAAEFYSATASLLSKPVCSQQHLYIKTALQSSKASSVAAAEPSFRYLTMCAEIVYLDHKLNILNSKFEKACCWLGVSFLNCASLLSTLQGLLYHEPYIHSTFWRPIFVNS